jgi:hypothetical protein
MRHVWWVAAFALAALPACPAEAPAAEPERPTAATPTPPPPGMVTTRTAKERQGGKAGDEQRVDDCKVPPERRTRARPAACPGEEDRR